MDANFDDLREAALNCIEKGDSSPNEVLLKFRNTANALTIESLLREYDYLRKRVNTPVATHSFGDLSAEEAALLHAFRQSDDRNKSLIRIAAEVAMSSPERSDAKARCEVVDIATARPPT